MEHQDFANIVTARLLDCEEVLIKKNKEYSSTFDRLHNFKVAGRIKGVDPVAALDGMWLKHRVSIADMVERMAEDPTYVPSRELVAEKLGDNINYTLLLEGLIEDRRDILDSDIAPPLQDGEATVLNDVVDTFMKNRRDRIIPTGRKSL